MKPFNPDPPDDPEFDGQQLHLPLDASLGERERVWDADLQWPSPHQLLGRFLEEIGVTQPLRIAGALIRDFGSVGGVMSASWWSLRRSVGRRVANAIEASRDLMQTALTESVARGPVISDRREVVKLLQAHLGSLRRERVVALYLNANLELLRIERISDGSATNCPIDLVKIIHCGLDVGACGFLLVHNHPSGDPTPSRTDQRVIGRLSRLAAELDMHVIDALVIAGGECVSILNNWTAEAD